MNQYRALILHTTSERPLDDRSDHAEDQSVLLNVSEGQTAPSGSQTSEPRFNRLRPLWIRDAHSDSNLLLVTYATFLEYLVTFYFYEAAVYCKNGAGRAVLLVPNSHHAAYWRSALASIDERERQRPQITLVTPENVNMPLILQTSLLLVDAAHLALGAHGASIEFSETGFTETHLSETVEYADAITRILFHRPTSLRVLAQMAGPTTNDARAALVALVARWLRCSTVRHIVPESVEIAQNGAGSSIRAYWPFTIIPFGVPSAQQLDYLVDQRRECLFEVLETQTGIFCGSEQIMVLCPTRRSAERSLVALTSRLEAQGPGNAIRAVPLLLANIPEDRRIKLQTLSSLLRNAETQRRALLGLGMLDPVSNAEAATSHGGCLPTAQSDRLILHDLFRAGALRVAVVPFSLNHATAANDDMSHFQIGGPDGKAPSSIDTNGSRGGSISQNIPIGHLQQMLDAMQKIGHRVVIVLKATHWTGFHGEAHSCRASALQALSRSIFRMTHDPVGVIASQKGTHGGVLRVRYNFLHRLITLTSSHSVVWTYLHVTGRLFTGDHPCTMSRDSSGLSSSQSWWMHAVMRMAARGLSMRLLREMNCCSAALAMDVNVSQWMKCTLHFVLSDGQQGSSRISIRGTESLSRALVRKLEHAGCILRETSGETLVVTMLGLAALKHQISPETILCFIRSAYGKPRCIGTFSNPDIDAHRFCIGYAPPRPTRRVVFDARRHSSRCRAVVELLYYVCYAGEENELCIAKPILNQFIQQTGWPAQTIPFDVSDRRVERLQTGEATFLLVQGWMATTNPPVAKTIYDFTLSIVHCLCAALSERPALYRESIIALLLAWMEKFRNGSEHASRYAAETSARLEHFLIECTERAPVSSSARRRSLGV
jgi:hypothetical protein